MNVQKLTSTIGGFITKNSPSILTGLSVAGLISTTVMAVKATPKALLLIEEEKYKRVTEGGDELSTKDVIGLAWKCYIPAAIMGAATITCIIGSNSINQRRNAALAGLYSLSEAALKEYKNKVVETIGEPKAREINDEIIKEKLHNNPVTSNEVIVAGKGEDLCYDALSGRYFMSDRETIKAALNELSHRLMTEMFISLNEVYVELGLERTGIGDLVGWYVEQGLIEPDFTSQVAEDGRPCLVLDFRIQPKYNDRDY
jgi:hypothetical protein